MKKVISKPAFCRETDDCDSGETMYSLLLAIIYLAFISLGLPDSLLGAAWPVLYRQLDVPIAFAGILTFIISCGTVLSSLMSDRLTRRFGAGWVLSLIHI